MKCLNCGNEITRKSNKSYCSRACRNKHLTRKDVEEEPKYPRTCPICGEKFLAKRPNKKYCSEQCNWKAQHEQKKARNPIKPSQKKIWKNRRLQQYKEQDGKCWLCEKELDYLFDLHHVTPGDHSPYSDDLIALCKSCHNSIHHVTVYVKPGGTLGFSGQALDLLKKKGYGIDKFDVGLDSR